MYGLKPVPFALTRATWRLKEAGERLVRDDSSRAEARQKKGKGLVSARLKPCPFKTVEGSSFPSIAWARTLPLVRTPRWFLFAMLTVSVAAVAAGCHSYHVETTIENRTGEPIQLLEVDYPSASYGADSLAAGADFHYRIQIEGKGQLKVLYTTSEGKPVQITGPALAEGEEGRLEVVLLPNGKAEFRPELSAVR
jgi:hypothetical protein